LKQNFIFNHRPVFFYLSFLLVVLVLLIYYLIGGKEFPDYSNYLTIVKQGGYLFSPNEYKAEWISRFILRNPNGLFGSSFDAVNFLVVTAQLSFFLFLFLVTRSKYVSWSGSFYFCLFSAPLLLTTAVRAAPVYLIMTYLTIFSDKMKFKWFLFWFFLALAFHDTAILIGSILGVQKFFYSRIGKINLNRIIKLVLMLSLVLILMPEFFTDVVRSLSTFVDLGIRATYFEVTIERSFIKRLFMLFILICVFLSMYRTKVIHFFHFSVAAIYLAASFGFVINEVVGIRMVLFVLYPFVYYNGGTFSSPKSNALLRIIDGIISSFYFLFSMYKLINFSEV
jgi:hypothetical protein